MPDNLPEWLGTFGAGPERDFRDRPAGAVIGLVTNNTDPQGMGRVKVRFPWLHDTEESHWARIAQPYAGPGRGTFWLPEVGDEVVVIFDRGDPNHPYVLGGVWNGEDDVPPPGNPDGEDNHKIWRTRSGHQIIFEDTDGSEKITLIDGVSERHLVIDVAADSITLTASPGDITFEAPQNTLTVACKDLQIDAKGSSTWTVGNDFTDTCDVRQETIKAADSIDVETTWTVWAVDLGERHVLEHLGADDGRGGDRRADAGQRRRPQLHHQEPDAHHHRGRDGHRAQAHGEGRRGGDGGERPDLDHRRGAVEGGRGHRRHLVGALGQRRHGGSRGQGADRRQRQPGQAELRSRPCPAVRTSSTGCTPRSSPPAAIP
jgi:phage baseplate assembly protein gpV